MYFFSWSMNLLLHVWVSLTSKTTVLPISTPSCFGLATMSGFPAPPIRSIESFWHASHNSSTSSLSFTSAFFTRGSFAKSVSICVSLVDISPNLSVKFANMSFWILLRLVENLVAISPRLAEVLSAIPEAILFRVSENWVIWVLVILVWAVSPDAILFKTSENWANSLLVNSLCLLRFSSINFLISSLDCICCFCISSLSFLCCSCMNSISLVNCFWKTPMFSVTICAVVPFIACPCMVLQ